MQGLQSILDANTMLLVVLGTALGIAVGAIPGLTGAMLISLTLPLTFSMEAGDALTLLVSMYVGSVSGGLITATLLRMPGTPASIMTTLDGYPMAKGGRPGRALGLGILSSFAGGMISWAFLVMLAGPIAHWSTRMGPFEFFSMVMMALVLIASVSDGSLVRGVFSGLLGLFVAMPGVAPGTGQVRLTLGIPDLNDGLDLLPVLIGLFALGQILTEAARADCGPADRVAPGRAGMFLTFAEWKAQAVNLLRSSVIGTWIGLLPGIGANIGSVMAYTAAKNASKTPEEFGNGADAGIVASESANNATVGGALIPLIALGIPGSVIDAILLGAFVIHGLQPGPMLFANDPQIVDTITGSYFWANICMAILMVASAGWLVRLTSVPRFVLVPVIMTFCVIGSFALANRFFDVWVMLGFGVAGFAMERWRIPLAPFVIGFVLGPVAEENLVAGLMQSGGSLWPVVTRPISLVFCALAVVMLVLPWWRGRKKKKRRK
jgi:putative tricarboxylic transport membrane protein